MLTRAEWSKVRHLMGKPRRCSQSFFDEERRELERRRQKIRLLQSKKSGDISFERDLPKEIPLSLPKLQHDCVIHRMVFSLVQLKPFIRCQVNIV